jgi:O-methyltransferase involved in polyketide biosynthesis
MAGIRPELDSVSETLLWTLYHRAVEARRPDAVLADPMAVELVEAIDYPFEGRFGRDVSARAQWQALRTRRFDDEVRRFLDAHPDGTVVALGEGLETQFWRVDNGRVRWLGVDLPAVERLRDRLFPAVDRRRGIAGSALDEAWLAQVDPAGPVLVTAQGLLMYLQPADAHRLIALCAQRFPHASLVFDGVLRWFSARTMRGAMRSATYASPPMPWGVDRAELAALGRLHPNIAAVRRLPQPRGRGVLNGYVLPGFSAVPGLRNLLPIWIMRADFRPASGDATG